MIGTITIHELAVDCIIGVAEEERSRPQPLRVDIAVDINFMESLGKHDVANTANWHLIAETVETLLREKKYHLAETACLDIARTLLKNPHMKGVRIRITKHTSLKTAKEVSAELHLDKTPEGMIRKQPSSASISQSPPW